MGIPKNQSKVYCRNIDALPELSFKVEVKLKDFKIKYVDFPSDYGTFSLNVNAIT